MALYDLRWRQRYGERELGIEFCDTVRLMLASTVGKENGWNVVVLKVG